MQYTIRLKDKIPVFEIRLWGKKFRLQGAVFINFSYRLPLKKPGSWELILGVFTDSTSLYIYLTAPAPSKKTWLLLTKTAKYYTLGSFAIPLKYYIL